MDKLLSCKHGIIKSSCVLCKDFSEEQVIAEKSDFLAQKNWQSSSYMDNSSHNSAMVEQEYDLEEDVVEFDNDSDME
jgi:hypothetical protein